MSAPRGLEGSPETVPVVGDLLNSRPERLFAFPDESSQACAA